MIQIILASIVVALGSYLIRKGDLFSIFLIVFQKSGMSNQMIQFTIYGILLNLIGIYFWQSSAKSNIPFQIAFSMYLSLTLIFGSLISYIFEKYQLGINFFLGTSLILAGIIILLRNNV